MHACIMRAIHSLGIVDNLKSLLRTCEQTSEFIPSNASLLHFFSFQQKISIMSTSLPRPSTPPLQTSPYHVAPKSAIADNAHTAPSLPASPIPKRPKFTNMASTAAPDASVTTAPTAPTASLDIGTPSLQVKFLNDKAKAPTRGSAFAAGYDLYCAKGTVITAKGKALVDTGLAIAVPAGTCTFIIVHR